MRRLFLSLTTWMILISGPAIAEEAEPASRMPHFNQMVHKAAEQGSIRVIVQLNVPEIKTLAAASAKFETGRTDAFTTIQAAVADTAMGARIAATADAIFQRMETDGVQMVRRYSALPIMALDVTPDALNALAQDPSVHRVSEDRLMRPLLNNTTNIIGATTSWANGYSGTGWYVAILDTGILSSHEFFSGKTIVESCFTDGDCPGNTSTLTETTGAAIHHPDTYGTGWDHGTHVAGIAAGNNGSTRFGVARDADIIAVQVFSQFDDDAENCPGPSNDCLGGRDSDILAGINHIYDLRLKYPIAAVNLSLGSIETFASSCDSSFPAYKEAIDLLNNAGIATVVASGNESNCNGASAPSCISSAISVGATDNTDEMAVFSNYHADLVDLFAPGYRVASSEADSNSSYGSKSGTSMSSPHVAGAFALLRQADADATVAELLDTLKDSGANTTGRAGCNTGGITLPVPRIKVDGALALATEAPTAPADLTATAADSDEINLTWSDSDNEQGFKIERKASAGGTFSEIGSVTADTLSYDDTTLPAEATAYVYRVRAYNTFAESGNSDEAGATTLLTAPSAFTAKFESETQIDLTWTDNSAAESGYEIERRTGGDSFAPIATLGANVTSYSDTASVSKGDTYYYRIRSSNGTLFSVYVQANTATGRSGGGGSSGGCFLSTIVR